MMLIESYSPGPNFQVSGILEDLEFACDRSWTFYGNVQIKSTSHIAVIIVIILYCLVTIVA